MYGTAMTLKNIKQACMSFISFDRKWTDQLILTKFQQQQDPDRNSTDKLGIVPIQPAFVVNQITHLLSAIGFCVVTK